MACWSLGNRICILSAEQPDAHGWIAMRRSFRTARIFCVSAAVMNCCGLAPMAMAQYVPGRVAPPPVHMPMPPPNPPPPLRPIAPLPPPPTAPNLTLPSQPRPAPAPTIVIPPCRSAQDCPDPARYEANERARRKFAQCQAEAKGNSELLERCLFGAFSPSRVAELKRCLGRNDLRQQDASAQTLWSCIGQMLAQK